MGPPRPLRRPLALLAVLLIGALAVLSGPSALAQDDVTGFRIRVFTGTGADQQRYPDIGVTVVDAEGNEVASGVTDAEGEVVLEMPGAGTYTARLDTGTFPPELAAAGGTTEREQRIQEGRTANALFRLGEGVAGEGAPAVTGGGRSFADKLGSVPQLFLDGIKLGFIIAITSIGLSLIFGTTGLVNFAHGELVTLGAVVAFFFNASPGGPRLHLILAAVIAIALGALSGGALDRGVWQPLRRRSVGLISMLVISIGLSFIIRNVILIMYGGATRPYAQYNIQRQIGVFGIRIVPRDLAIIVLSFVVLVGIGLMLQRTKIGKALRAVADNRDLAESSGIDVKKVIRFVWLLGGGLAAFGGVLLGSTEQVNVNMGFNLLLLMFAGVILGGIGTAYGAMVGSLVVGVISQVSTAFFSVQLKFVWALLLLIIVLLIKPQGLLGRAERFG